MQADQLMERFGEATGAVAVSGYVSKAPKGRWRVHPWLDPQVFIEFDGDDVIRTLPLDRRLSPLGGSYVVLRSDAQVLQVKGDRQTAETDFLAGDIVHGALKEAKEVTLAIGITITTTATTTIVPITVTWAIGCFTDWVCDTGTMRCLGSVICNTGQMVCRGTVVLAPSTDWMCNSHYCPSEGANCPSINCGGGGGGDGDGPVLA